MLSNKELGNFVGNVAVVTTAFQFLSGILVCKKFVVNNTTGEASPLPFLCGALSTGVWLLYGVYTVDQKIVLINQIGFTLMVAYLFVFYKYTIKKSVVLKQIYVSVTLAALGIGYILLAADNETWLTNILGLAGATLTVLTIAAPLSKILHVIRSKNTECLPFPLILMSFVVSALWWGYGVLETNYYLIWPNAVGCTIAAFQLLLFVILPSRTMSPKLVQHLIA